MKLLQVLSSAVVVLLLACAYVPCGSSAQTGRKPTELPPLPVGEKNFPRSLAPVVMAEHAFAQRAIDEGMKPAFVNHAAPDGVIVGRRGFVNAVETWSKREPAPTGLLTWWPTYADVSRAGDLGWTTGPYEFREKPTDAKPGGAGHFFTVWRKQPDGAWKWVLDFGTPHPSPGAPETALRYPATLLTKGPLRGASDDDPEAVRRSLLEEERALSEASASKGMRAALLARADEGVRLMRQNSFPVVGREALARALKVQTEFISWEPLKVDAAASGDLGYAYGSYSVNAPGAERPAEHGYYARVWKRRPGGPWRVVMNVTNPAQ
jgi:ketosteroid isomerase-like protein